MASTYNKSSGTQPKYTSWHGLGSGFMVELPQGHAKVSSRSRQGQISSKRLKIAYYCCFSYNYVHLRCLWWLETNLDFNKDLYQNTQRSYRGDIRVGGFLSPSNHPCVTPVCSGRNSPKIFKNIYLDRWPALPINPKYTWWHGLELGFLVELP